MFYIKKINDYYYVLRIYLWFFLSLSLFLVQIAQNNVWVKGLKIYAEWSENGNSPGEATVN